MSSLSDLNFSWQLFLHLFVPFACFIDLHPPISSTSASLPPMPSGTGAGVGDLTLDDMMIEVDLSLPLATKPATTSVFGGADEPMQVIKECLLMYCASPRYFCIRICANF